MKFQIMAAPKDAAGSTVYPVPSPRFDNAVIADRIRRAREFRGWSKKEFAGLTGIEVEAYYKKERGVAPFYLPELSRIGEVLEAGSLFPFLDFDAAKLVDRLLGRESGPSGRK